MKYSRREGSPFPILPLVGSLVVGLAGCGDDPSEVRAPADGGSSSGAIELEWAVERTLRADFGAVFDADIDACGRIWVADRQTQTLEIHDESGESDEVGTRGQGPGEFRWIRSIRFADDTAFVLDSGNQRISVYVAPCGGEVQLERTIPLFLEGSARAAGTIGRAEGGDFLVWTEQPMLIDDHAPEPLTELERVAAEGKRPHPPVLSVRGTEVLAFQVGGGGVASPMPFGSEPVIRLLDRRHVVAGTTSDPMLTFHDLAAGTTDSLRLPLTPRRVEPGDVSYLLDSMRENGSPAVAAPFPFGSAARIEVAQEEGRLPEFHPLFRRFEVDDEFQWLWVQTLDEADRFLHTDEGFTGYVNAEGNTRFLGLRLSTGETFGVTTPDRRTLLGAYGGKLLTLVEDELGVQSLEVLSVDAEP